MDFLTENTENMECPICMDVIDLNKNCTKTECGHMFHSSCLMKNIAHNGLNCPYCRNVMAEEPEEEYSDDESDGLSESDGLTGSWSAGLSESDGESDGEDENIAVPTTNYVAKKLLEQGVTFEQLVHMYCNLDHDEFHEYEDANIFEDELFGKIRMILSCYQENTETAEEPSVSEPKTVCKEDSVHQVNKECID